MSVTDVAGSGADDGPPTGHPAIDEALARLARLENAPPAEQIGALTAAHDALRQTLDTIGSG